LESDFTPVLVEYDGNFGGYWCGIFWIMDKHKEEIVYLSEISNTQTLPIAMCYEP
jgi:hypothetical protein